MSNYNNIRGKNQRNSNQDWNNDYDQNRNRGFDNDRQDDDQRNQNYGGSNEHNQHSGIGNYGQGDRNSYGSESGRGFDRQYDRNEQQRNDRWNTDQSFGGSYGSDRGQQFRGKNDNWDNDRNSFGNDFGGNRNSGRTQSGNSGFGGYDNDRNRSQGNDRNDRGWWDKTRDEVSSWFGDDEADRRRRQDSNQSQSQSHRGKGPKGYTRSDDRIKDDINDRLSDDHHIDASNITVEVKDGEVVLSGSVNDRNAKRHAEDLTESISGVKNVENRIRVGNNNDSNNNSSSGSQANQSAKNTANAGSFETKKS